MVLDRDSWATREIRLRAAIVRRAWSENERLRRHGLPPDIPRQLLSYFGERLADRLAAPKHAVALVVRQMPSQNHGL